MTGTDLPEGAAPEADAQAHRLSRGSRGLLWSGFVGMSAAAVLALVPLPYVVMRPGPATNTLGAGADGKPLITVSGAPTYPAKGALDFTTVRVIGGPGTRVNLWDVLYGWVSPSAEVVDEADIFPPNVTSRQVQDQNAAEMTQSQQEAVAVALRSLGKKVTERYLIASLSDGSPATGHLEPGDQIVAVDGESITGIADIQRLVRSRPAGSTLEFRILRDGRALVVSAPSTDLNGTPVIGIRLRTEFDYPFEVAIDAGGVGGPSAGTMFALGVRDLLTPGDLTGGRKIAGTGTIDDSGRVGPIGGIRQKVYGAKDAGAGYFLAPADNCPDLLDHVPGDLTVVKIATYDDAVHAVESIAAGFTADLPHC